MRTYPVIGESIAPLEFTFLLREFGIDVILAWELIHLIEDIDLHHQHSWYVHGE